MTGVSLLWALRSPCNLGCRYCYFGTIEEHRASPPSQPGVLSHLATTDLDLEEITAFIDTFRGSRIERVFLAGGEPLIWPPIMHVVRAIKAADVEVVLCTNGIPLNRPVIVDQILSVGVDAVSVSLDSVHAAHNDAWRPARNGVHGHADVLTGITALLTARGAQTNPRVGIYAVITRLNINSITSVGMLAADLGCDYYVPQPVALAADHALYQELSLTTADVLAVAAALTDLYERAPLHLPPVSYIDQFLEVTRSTRPGFVSGCFGGTDLFFIEPDGSVWDCPSSVKIASTPQSQYRSIRGADARELFGAARPCRDCALFTRDCVNMWPLMDFGSIVQHADV